VKKILSVWLSFLLISAAPAHAADTAVAEKVKATVLIASNEGVDSTPIRDAYRRELIKLFSYTAYSQAGDEKTLTLEKDKRETLNLPGGYKFILTLQSAERNRMQVQAVIQKGSVQYMNTVVSILKPGVVFLGGPSAKGGVLIIVLETQF
jgi:hypothetical protein